MKRREKLTDANSWNLVLARYASMNIIKTRLRRTTVPARAMAGLLARCEQKVTPANPTSIPHEAAKIAIPTRTIFWALSVGCSWS